MKCSCCTETRTTRAWTCNSACASAKLSSITLPDFLAFACLTLCSPSYAASARGHVDIVDMLISAGQLPRHTPAPPKPFRKQHKLNVIFWGKIEALRVAISFLCRQNLFRWALSNCPTPPPCLSSGADVNEKSSQWGATALHHAVGGRAYGVVRLLITR